jgi:hypothetical protein
VRAGARARPSGTGPAWGLSIRGLEAPPIGGGQRRQQAHEERRQRRRLQGMGAAVGGLPTQRPAFPTPAALDLEAGGPLVADEAQSADEHHGGEAVPLRTDDGELARDLRVDVGGVVWQRIHRAHLCGYQGRRPAWQGRRTG